MYGAFGFVKVQNPRGTGELRQIDKDDGKIPGNSEVDFRNEALALIDPWQPPHGVLSVIGIYRQLRLLSSELPT